MRCFLCLCVLIFAGGRCVATCPPHSVAGKIEQIKSIVDSIAPENRLVLFGETHGPETNDYVLYRFLQGRLYAPGADTVGWIIEAGAAEAWAYEQYINGKMDRDEFNEIVWITIYTKGFLDSLKFHVAKSGKYTSVHGIDYEKSATNTEYVIQHLLEKAEITLDTNDPLWILCSEPVGRNATDSLKQIILTQRARYDTLLGPQLSELVYDMVAAVRMDFTGQNFNRTVRHGIITETLIRREEFISANLDICMKRYPQRKFVGSLGRVHVTRTMNTSTLNLTGWSSAVARLLSANPDLESQVFTIPLIYPIGFFRPREVSEKGSFLAADEWDVIRSGYRKKKLFFVFDRSCRADFDMTVAFRL